MAGRTKTVDITGDETAPRITTPPPGPVGRAIIEKDHRYLATTTKTAPLVARKAKGAVVLGVDGNVYLDFCAGIGVLNTGHGHPGVLAAVQRQLGDLVHFAGTDFYYQVQADLAERLAGLAPGGGARKVFFANSGTEANEAALKLARWSSKRSQFIAFQRAFHGRTMGALALTSSKTVQRERFFPTMPGVHTVPFPDPYRNRLGIDGYEDPQALTSGVLGFLEDLLESQLPPSEAAAMFVEPIQGEGGYNFPPLGFHKALKKVLDAHGILMVADEIQTGIGRTGKMFAMEHYGVSPQIMTVAKALGSGFPIGACVFEAGLDFGVSGAHSNTFGGNLVSAAASLATLEAIQSEGLLANASKVGRHLGKRLDELKDEHAAIGDARGLGLMHAIDLVKDHKTKTPDTALRGKVVQSAIAKGLIVLPAGRSAIRFIPPLIVNAAQVDGAIEVLEAALKEHGA
jgi:4-aminobutyrate aminotransferase